MEVQKIPKRTVTLIEPKKSILVDKEKYHQKRVAAYCRVSTDSEEQLTSYQNQMRVYTEMIAANKEWEFAGLYADEGISGTRADKRPEFQRMIRDCQNGKIDYIITKSVSRFARNTVECLEYVRSLKAQGIGIFFEEQNIDTLKNESELYLVIYAGFAQSESESISKHITWTYRKKFEEGNVSFQYKSFLGYRKGEDTLIQNWNGRVTSDDTVYVLGDAFWKNEENSIRIMERLRGHKHLIQGNHDRVKGKLRPYWESIEQYAEVNDENRLVILSHYPILFYKNQHYGAVMLYGHVHNTREWKLVEKWKNEQWAMGIPSRLINVGCMMDYMRYTPRTLTELLDANPMPEIARDRKDGSAVESAE